jgi:tRNA(fMet)-specific endonuclease VapC
MTGSKCILDTSVIIDVFKQHNTIAQKLDQMSEIYVPVVVVGELLYGAYKSNDPGKHIRQLQSFLTNCKILRSDEITADHYGSIKAVLSNKGKPIPENDIWIAATARQHNLPLFTSDKHFQEIDSLNLI